MRASSWPPSSTPAETPRRTPLPDPQPDAREAFLPPEGGPPSFLPFGAQAFDQARVRRVPVFLVIGELSPAFSDPSLAMQITERTVPVHLSPGTRPDVELLCQRAGALFSQEGALPLCALLLDDARPFLAAPLPPAGFPLDPSRLYVWLYQADRRFSQNLAGFIGQAAQVMRSFRPTPLRRPYSPRDASHDLSRALEAVEDPRNGGFGEIKSPMVSALRYLQQAAARGDSRAHTSLTRALDAMLASSLYDPLDGSFFRATLTDDWRVFVPEKPLGIGALLALILLEDGRRSEAVRALDFLLNACSLAGGGLAPYLRASRESFAFTPEQVCAALGNEDGLRAARLLNLRRQQAGELPQVTPSRFSPVPADASRSRHSMDTPPLTPTLSASLTPEDTAFLRRVTPALSRVRAARSQPQLAPHVLTEDCALAAAVFALCGRRLGETRYTQAAQRAVSFLIALPSAGSGGLAPSCAPVSPLHAQATCGASAALALALLTLGQGEGMEAYQAGGLRLLGAALHAFLDRDGLPMHTPQDPAAFLPRIPAVYDGELPSPAALLVHALRLAHAQRPDAHYAEAIDAIWAASAPAVREQPLACAALIDAVTR